MRSFAYRTMIVAVIFAASNNISAADAVKRVTPVTQQQSGMTQAAPAGALGAPRTATSPNKASASSLYKISPATLNQLKYSKANRRNTYAAQAGEKAFKHYQAVYVQFYAAVDAAEKKIDNDCLVRGYTFNDKQQAGCLANESGKSCDIKLVKYCAAMELNTVRGLYPGLIKELTYIQSLMQLHLDIANNLPHYMEPYF